MGILDVAITGLLSAQRSLATVGHNISNANTPGYSRQRVESVTRPSQFSNGGFLGRGVDSSTINRVYDQFITNQLYSNTANASAADAFFSLASRIDTLLTEDAGGLASSLQDFFDAIQDVTNLPASSETRQSMINEARSLVERFQFLDDQLNDLENKMSGQFEYVLNDINSLAKSIAHVNSQIVLASNKTPPNDLLDQRDELLRQLSELIQIEFSEQEDGTLNVFIGSGQPLVLRNDTNHLSIKQLYGKHTAITLDDVFNSRIRDNSITGGKLSGLLNFQAQVLEPTRNALGRLAIGLADTFNEQHRLGINLENEIGIDFFSVATPEVLALDSAPDVISAAIVDPAALSDSDYSLEFIGGDNYKLTRLGDGHINMIETAGASPFNVTIDGVTITITSGAAVGDKYIIRPTINGMRDIEINISDPKEIAAAAPLRASVATDNAGSMINSGTGKISELSLSSIAGLPLTSAITLTFDAVLNQFSISAPPGGTLNYDPATEGRGKQFTIAAANVTFTISGKPAEGDQFIVENNNDASGDNRNMLALSELQSRKLLLNASASYQDSYGQIVSKTGSLVHQAEVNNNALDLLLENIKKTKDSISGVNLDEEAADTLRFQQAYRAAAEMISVADTIFQALLDSVR